MIAAVSIYMNTDVHMWEIDYVLPVGLFSLFSFTLTCYLGNSVMHSGDSYFPQPSPGESLRSYLSSQDFDTCAELDRVRVLRLVLH